MKNYFLSSAIAALFCFNSFAQQTVGLFSNQSSAQTGYVLFAPTRADSTYLIDKCGKRIHQWSSNFQPGLSVYLLPNGDLLRSCSISNPYFGGLGGRIERRDWDDNLLWSTDILDSLKTQNHDIYPMPNGNILAVIWEKYSVAEAIAMGRNPATLGSELWSAKIIEIEPTGTSGANIAWEWRFWDHLVQQYDSTKPNYAPVANHPELLDLNFTNLNPGIVDWLHLNSVSYNEQLDLIIICSHTLSEIYIIDHSTTTVEAASHSGGRYNKGGDFLYRWGNPAAYKRATFADKKLYLPHNPYWIPQGFPGEGKIMIFNNGVNRPGGNASSVDIISPETDSLGHFVLLPGQPYGPDSAEWSYMAPNPTDFYTPVMGGAMRLQNGNTIVCESTKGNFFEIDSLKNIVWRYVAPVNNNGIISQGTIPTGNSVYRSELYMPGFAGFTGRSLVPGEPIELNPLADSCSMITAIEPLIPSSFNSVSVSPNPFNYETTISWNGNSQNIKMELCNAYGRIIETHAGTSNQVIIKKGNKIPGVYFCKLIFPETGQLQTIKLVLSGN